MLNKPRAIFLTGGTGFIGGNIARRCVLTWPNTPIFLLARDYAGKSAQERITGFLQNFYGRVIKGDICEGPLLGIGANDLEHLKEFDLEIWHIAGNISFDEKNADELFEVNLDGTRNVLRFAEFMRVKRFYHMSTAYVAGDRTNLGNHRATTAYEDERWVGQEFRNTYEESKLNAELFIHEMARKLKFAITIFRIGIIVGDSKTGETTTFSGYYGYFKALNVLRNIIKDDMPMYSAEGVRKENGYLFLPACIKATLDATINIACVDYIVDIIMALAQKPESAGKTFHVVNPSPPKLGWILATGHNAMQIKFKAIIDPAVVLPDICKDSSPKLQKWIDRAIIYYQDYALGEPVFDNANIKNVLGSIPPHPEITIELVKKLLDYAQTKNFGRKKNGNNN